MMQLLDVLYDVPELRQPFLPELRVRSIVRNIAHETRRILEDPYLLKTTWQYRSMVHQLLSQHLLQEAEALAFALAFEHYQARYGVVVAYLTSPRLAAMAA